MSEMTYYGMGRIISSYLRTKYPGLNYEWEIGLVQKNTTPKVVNQYNYGHPAKHSYKLVFKDILGNVVYESDLLESIRINAWTVEDCGRFLATMKKVS